ncbi:MAG: type I glutamate--ammonia ligase [Candidatus Bathyarchaeia archaeon]|nr:type I glutamate--ammonia ligase [Candidatus Bathyarchaeota archaeon]
MWNSNRKTSQNVELCFKLMKNAEHVLLHFTDLLGYLRGRTVPADEAENTLKEGVGFDGSSLIGGVGIEESDMIMKPDITTFTVCPYYFYDKSVVSFICDIYTPEGKRFEGDPRYICQKSLVKMRAEGYEPTAAAELEFYLVQKTSDGSFQPIENHLLDRHRYFDIAPGRDLTENFRLDLANALFTMGIDVEREHHEVGAAQNEITFRYADPLTTSDNIVRYKFAAKAVADRKYGWIATFMPKPWFGKPGSGMHIHLGLFDVKTGRNLFYDKNGYAYISQKCRYFIGGILEHARALCAIVAPTVNSYKRLVPGYEAPVYITWSRKNRSALIRVPEYFPGKENEARIEFRCPDPLCNPYLAYVAVFEAGLDGIRKKIEPGDPVDVNVYHLSDAKRRELGIKVLPSSLKEALEEWESDDICIKALGRETAEKYLELKMQEWKEYEPHMPENRNEVTWWEQQKYIYA